MANLDVWFRLLTVLYILAMTALAVLAIRSIPKL